MRLCMCLDTQTGDDLKDMYKWVKPQCVIPVHGEHRHMAEHVSFAKEMQVPKTLLIENGDIIRILPGNKPEIIDKAPSGKNLFRRKYKC